MSSGQHIIIIPSCELVDTIVSIFYFKYAINQILHVDVNVILYKA
jgi:hypothetical protein